MTIVMALTLVVSCDPSLRDFILELRSRIALEPLKR